jgi:GTP diphosphokinase / guanosine-3',5'-bis(diphosphate) 3'-diphosphatase
MTTVQQIIGQLHNPTAEDKRLITEAYELANKAHEGASRYSGEPYMSHVAEVAFMLAEMGMGPRTITAGLLHDVIEDTAVTRDELKAQFGEEILFLVEGVTKLSAVRYYGTDRHNESLRKLFVATSQDIRVLIIKLTDRLHNMRTLEYVPKEKQLRIARETLEIYVPVAHRLGMGRIRKELEDMAFPYVYPEEYQQVLTTIEGKTKKQELALEKERKALQKRLVESGMHNFTTSYRIKGLYSLYHKLRRKDWDIEQIYDLMALRIVVENVEQCYQVLGIVHELWRPLPQRVKDYIAFPKPNGYKSLHTTVATPLENIIEVQIRTKDMHHEAEYGVASHIMYKNIQEGSANSSWFSKFAPYLFRPFSKSVSVPATLPQEASAKEKIPQWINEIGNMYSKEAVAGNEFADDMRSDFFQNRIFVFTPNGDVVDLPVGATPIDFAYAIHSEIGDTVSGVKVNKKMSPLDTTLRNGDMVEVETSKNAQPREKWLTFAKTGLAKRHIRNYLESEKR